jgi:predicted RNA-binding Zn-ribbon protein involved in translation (DUF1610 family)
MLVCPRCGSNELVLIKRKHQVTEPRYRCIGCGIIRRPHELRQSISSHTFVIDGGRQPLDGKVHWPDQLNLRMPREHAWNLMHALMDYLHHNSCAGGDIFIHTFCGQHTLEENDTLSSVEESDPITSV